MASEGAESAWARGSTGRLVGTLWVVIAVAIGCRIAHYVPFVWPAPVEWALGQLMRTQVVQLLLGFLAFPIFLPLSLAIGVVALLRWRLVLEVREGRLGTRPWVLAFVSVVLLVHNVGLTLDPVISAFCWISFLALWPGALDRLAGRRRWLRIGIGAAAWLLFAAVISDLDTQVERGLLLGWAVFIVLFAWLANPRTWLRDRLWVALLASVVPQFLFTQIPLESPDHGGKRIGNRDYAYNFCEIPERDALFASVPCDEGRNGCERGFVAQHDLRDLAAEPRIHELLDEEVDGRIVHVECMGDEVWVGMAVTRYGEEELRENVMRIVLDDPEALERRVFDEPFGARFAWDERHDAVYLIAEWQQRIRRLDLSTGQLDTKISDGLYGAGADGFGSHLVQQSAFHHGRDSVFFVQWLSGSRAFEIDRESLELVQTLDAHHGGNHGVAVDEELGRLWVTSVFGVDLLDIESGRVLFRERLGVGTRDPVVDTRNDRVYVTTTTGRLWILDRRTPRILGSLAIGRGSRNANVSKDGRRLYASVEGGYFVFSTDELRRRFPTPD